MDTIGKLKRTKYGFYQRVTDEQTHKYMLEEEYYQGKVETYYRVEYSEEELRSFLYHSKKKAMIIRRFLPDVDNIRFLDVGCGDGELISHLRKYDDFSVEGIDISSYLMEIRHPECLECFHKGDAVEFLNNLDLSDTFNVINFDLSLECTLKIDEVLWAAKKAVSSDGIFIIRYSNNLSPLHDHLMEKGIIEKDSWLNRTGNIWYFGKDSFNLYLEEQGFEVLDYYADSFVDFYLLHPNTDYYRIPDAGRKCYLADLKIEEMMCEQSIEKRLEYERLMGEFGFGRHLTCVCRVRK